MFRVLSISTIVGCSALALSACERGASKERAVGAAESSLKATASASNHALEPARQRTEKPPKAPFARIKAAAPAHQFGTLPKGIGRAVGSAVPDVSATDLNGETVSLTELAAKGPTLLVFYRGGWCPFCNFQIRQLTQAYDKFQARSVQLALVSVDTVDEAKKTSAVYRIPFPVLSDSDLKMHRAFGVLNELDEAAFKRLKDMNLDLEKSSGQKHHTIAVPSAFVLAGDKVVFAHAEKDYKSRPTTEQLMGALDKLGYKAKDE